MTDKSISLSPENEKGQPHGYWEVYNAYGKFHYKCTFNNGKEVGYDEWHRNDGLILITYWIR